MNNRFPLVLLGCTLALSGCFHASKPKPDATVLGSAGPPSGRAQLEAEVMETERAFAKSMADRDVKAFGSFIAEDAVFFSDDPALRGRDAVVTAWQRYFVTAQAPFSWSPARASVNDAGTEAMDTGPVMAPDGKTKIGSFTSVWRRGGDGKWKIIWDNGCSCSR